MLESGGLGIVAGTQNLEAAKRFVRFATTAQSMAAVARYVSSSPTRRSAMALVSTHVETGVDMRPHLPTSSENKVHALYNDWEWWSDNGEEINERFGWQGEENAPSRGLTRPHRSSAHVTLVVDVMGWKFQIRITHQDYRSPYPDNSGLFDRSSSVRR